MNEYSTFKQFDITLLQENESLTNWESLESMIFKLNEDSSLLPKILDLIKSHFLSDLYSIYELINYAACVREFSFKIYGDLFSQLETQKINHNFKLSLFIKYLISRGVLDESNIRNGLQTSEIYPIEYYENVFPNDSIEFFILNDDLDQIINKLSANFHSEKIIISFRGTKYNLLTLSALCGSIQCFKYFLLNNFPLENDLLQKSSVKSGNEEIVELIVSKDLSYQECLEIAIQYHRNELAQWIITNYETEQNYLSITILSYNTLAFLYYYNKDKKEVRDDGITPLIHAAMNGNVPITRFILDDGANVNTTSSTRKTPLMFASQNGFTEIIKLLLERGADINKQDDNGYTALFYAAIGNYFDCFKLLIDKGIDLSHVTKQNESIMHILCEYDSTTELIDYLISQKGMSIEIKDGLKRTPIFHAILRSNIPVIHYLISKGVNIEARDKNDMTPLLYASSLQNIDVLTILVNKGHSNLYAEDSKQRTAAHLAASEGDLSILNYIVNSGIDYEKRDKLGNTPLMAATIVNRISAVQFLAQIGCNIEAKDKQGWSPLERAAHNGSLSLVSYLVDKGADVNSFDKQKWTPLHRAAYNGHIGVVRYLLNNDADPDAKNKKGKKAIDLTQNETIKQILREASD